MHIAIVGAGYSGLATASTLLSFGHSVVIFDSSPDVGGVWSSINHYPGLKAQNDKDTYCFSTLPMPKDYPTHPDGQQIQAYLELYVKMQGLDKEGGLRLNTKVIKAERRPEGWVLEVHCNHSTQLLSFDYLICATGVFSQPFVPAFAGAEEFTQAGGIISHTSNFHRLVDIKDKDVIVVGFGKSACDTAVAASSCAQSVTIVARNIIWKLPTYVGGVLHYSYLLLTRCGEALFPYIRPWKSQKFLNYGYGKPIRDVILALVGYIISIQLKLVQFNLVPNKPFETLARSSVSLATPGIVKAFSTGKIKVERGVTITSLSPGKAILSNGKELSADVVICGTGWTHHAPDFLPKEYEKQLLDENKDWILYRHVFPTDIPGLAFMGYNSSVFCPLTAEMTAIWLASHLENDIRLIKPLPPVEERRHVAETEAAWHRKRTEGHHANGTSIVPFSLSNIDEMLADLKVKVGWSSYIREWLLPVDPAAYRNILPEVLRRRDNLRAELKKTV
ncbi:uncharacterized protein I303_108694 [Kwoniella dejecticola CBS 10117]|uniref:Monooxygenase n=1 Tax=Kwoniella dejecticola CBS 10117 TaxID=1296121 RepID=A0A1A5ZWP1_9TREE|nr:uncharacterized protein I303_06981 [Kwoniella dejecticola CBS 10117]OBR82222.1 hypothetical protein I303_06981 [Kwoniella dejecticola CBS 10117]